MACSAAVQAGVRSPSAFPAPPNVVPSRRYRSANPSSSPSSPLPSSGSGCWACQVSAMVRARTARSSSGSPLAAASSRIWSASSRLSAGSLSVQAAISLAQDSEMSPAAIVSAIRRCRASRLCQATAPPAAPLEMPVRLISQARADRCPSGSYPDWAVNADRTAALTAVSLACARCSRASISPCAAVPSDAQSTPAR